MKAIKDLLTFPAALSISLTSCSDISPSAVVLQQFRLVVPRFLSSDSSSFNSLSSSLFGQHVQHLDLHFLMRRWQKLGSFWVSWGSTVSTGWGGRRGLATGSGVGVFSGSLNSFFVLTGGLGVVLVLWGSLVEIGLWLKRCYEACVRRGHAFMYNIIVSRNNWFSRGVLKVG